MKFYFGLLLITLVFGHGLQVVEEKIEEEDRRELLIVTSAIIAACISGAVGGIVSAVASKGIDSCGGRRDKTIVIIRDERTGEYKQQGRRHLLGSERRLLSGVQAAGEQNEFGVLFDSNGVTCPADAEHTVVALQKNQAADGSSFFTIPNDYFEPEAFEKLSAIQQNLYQKIRTKTLPYNSNSLPSKKNASWRPRNVMEIPAIQSLKTMLGLRRPDPSSRS